MHAGSRSSNYYKHRILHHDRSTFCFLGKLENGRERFGEIDGSGDWNEAGKRKMLELEAEKR